MNQLRSSSDLSVLSLLIEIDQGNPDRPTVAIEVDGKAPFAAVADGWRGFDPADVLGSLNPLLPTDQGRRVAVYRCSCGEPGCGVIAPMVELSLDGRRVSWVDFRDYTGVFDGPISEVFDENLDEGKPWRLPDLHFDREQYEAEVARAAADRSWETPRRKVARLVEQRLRDIALELPPNLGLEWVTPACQADGVELAFRFETSQLLLHLTSQSNDPHRAADDIVDQLVRTPPADRARVFERRVPYR